MSLSRRWSWRRCLFCLIAQACLALPALAQETSPPPADSTVGFVFRWLNMALVLGAIVWAIRKLGAPYFRANAQAISDAIHGAAVGRAAAESALSEAVRQLASLDTEIQELRRAAGRESTSEAERLRELARAEAQKIARAAGAEITAAERAARMQLQAIAARAATDRAAELVRKSMTDARDRSLFSAFVAELERTAR